MYSVEQLSQLGHGYDVSDIVLLDIPQLVPEGTELVVVDNLGVFVLDLSVKDFRGQFDALNLFFSNKDCTTLFVMDETAYQMTNRIADYSAYGAVHLSVKENPYTNKMERYIRISKMRNTKISLDISSFEITSSGIAINQHEKEHEDLP